MKSEVINKTMDRADLASNEAQKVVCQLNDLIRLLYSKKLYMTSWYGSWTDKINYIQPRGVKGFVKNLIGKKAGNWIVGAENRGADYKPLRGAVDDARIPWYLYWEICQVINYGPSLQKGYKLLDAGGTASLFTCYLAALGYEVHSVDMNEELVSHGNRISKAMGWNMHSYAMNMKKLEFKDETFDHAYSICVFEHLEYDIKQSALREIARCLKPGGILSITFDYRNPAPTIAFKGADTSEANQLKTKEDIQRSFLSTGFFEVAGNQDFLDNGKSYLVHPTMGNTPYTFGSIFLRKKS